MLTFAEASPGTLKRKRAGRVSPSPRVNVSGFGDTKVTGSAAPGASVRSTCHSPFIWMEYVPARSTTCAWTPPRKAPTIGF